MTIENLAAGSAIASRYDDLINTEGPLRIRDAASRLSLTELELLLAGLEDQGEVTRLSITAKEFFGALPEFGPVMTLVRNEVAVHEKTGVFGPLELTGHVGLVMHDEIDLRLFLSQWKHFVAVKKEHSGRTLRSVQVFDAYGDAVQKIYAKEEPAISKWEELVAAHAGNEDEISLSERKVKVDVVPEAFDGEAFRAGWLGMQDTHEFFGLCHKHGITRHRALLEAPEGHAVQLDPSAVAKIVEVSAETELPIMVFVGNPGSIQIHTGAVKRIMWRDAWFNVIDPTFNLHLNTELVSEAWIVRKPTEDGIVTSVEAYDSAGEIVVYLFGERKPGVAELESWRDLVAELEKTDASN